MVKKTKKLTPDERFYSLEVRVSELECELAGWNKVTFLAEMTQYIDRSVKEEHKKQVAEMITRMVFAKLDGN